MASFSVCSLFGLPFVLLCFLSVYPFLSLSRYVPYPFRSMACKKRRGTQVQIVSRIDPPPPARPARYRSDGRPRIISDIGRSHGRPSIPPEDRFGPFGSEPAWPSAAAFLLLDRYRVQMIRYGPSPISDSMDGSFRYRSLEVHVVSMDHPVPYLVLDRYIGTNGPIPISVRISGPNWAFAFIPAIHRYLDHLIHGVNGPNGSGSFILLNRYIGKWTESDIDVGIPLRRFLVRHVIVVLG